ncbi:MAG: copper homeostasis membrane protein CopD [Proteobacteria bacterium]|nr:copper homeostasis membrane protein CopD [Pseudomonadota bacterium]
MSALQAALVVARFTHYAALTLAFGAALFPLYAYGPDAGLRARAGRSMAGLMPACAAVALVSGLGWLAVSAATMADDPAAAVDPTTLRLILTEMDFGRIWAVRMALAALLVVASLWGRGTPGRLRLAPPLLSGLLLVSVAATGHGISGPEGLGVWHGLADGAHLLAAGAWLGALVPLAMLARPEPGATPDAVAELARMLARFSKVGYLAVATLVATGLVNAWLLVGSVEGLVATAYGRVLLVKLALFAAMLGFAAANRFKLTPALAGLAYGDNARPLLGRLRRHVMAEQALGLMILAAVSLLGTLAPPASA